MLPWLPTHIRALKQSLRLLRTPRFGTYYAATLLSNIGAWSQQVAEPWLLINLGASSFLIGLDSFAQSAPVWILILAGGMLADKADRRRVITIFQAIQMMCPVALVAVLLTHMVQPWMVVALSLVVGITDAPWPIEGIHGTIENVAPSTGFFVAASVIVSFALLVPGEGGCAGAKRTSMSYLPESLVVVA